MKGEHGGGRIHTKTGFMMVHAPATENENCSLSVGESEKGKPKKRKSHAETLSKKVTVKSISKKANLESFRNKFATIKKKLDDPQVEHGGSADYLLVVKNNIQVPNTPNAKTAGKNMVMTKGPIRDQYIHKGVKFVKDNCYMMANCESMKEEIIQEISSDESDELEKEEAGGSKSESSSKSES